MPSPFSNTTLVLAALNAQIEADCLARGLTHPFTVLVTAHNGSALSLRFHAGAAMPEPLGGEILDEQITFPLTVIAVDTGERRAMFEVSTEVPRPGSPWAA